MFGIKSVLKNNKIDEDSDNEDIVVDQEKL